MLAPRLYPVSNDRKTDAVVHLAERANVLHTVKTLCDREIGVRARWGRAAWYQAELTRCKSCLHLVPIDDQRYCYGCDDAYPTSWDHQHDGA